MDQDGAWKRLFGRPVVVHHLLRGFAGEVAELLDLDTLHRLPASWVAPDDEQRHGDVACRVWYADDSGRSLVVPIEHQSTVDEDMAVRVLTRDVRVRCAAARMLDPKGRQGRHARRRHHLQVRLLRVVSTTMEPGIDRPARFRRGGPRRRTRSYVGPTNGPNAASGWTTPPKLVPPLSGRYLFG